MFWIRDAHLHGCESWMPANRNARMWPMASTFDDSPSRWSIGESQLGVAIVVPTISRQFKVRVQFNVISFAFCILSFIGKWSEAKFCSSHCKPVKWLKLPRASHIDVSIYFVLIFHCISKQFKIIDRYWLCNESNETICIQIASSDWTPLISIFFGGETCSRTIPFDGDSNNELFRAFAIKYWWCA